VIEVKKLGVHLYRYLRKKRFASIQDSFYVVITAMAINDFCAYKEAKGVLEESKFSMLLQPNIKYLVQFE